MSVKIQSNDSQVVEVEENVARMSKTISNMLDDLGISNDAVYLPTIKSEMLTKILDYCKFVTSNPDIKKDEFEKFEKEYIDIERLKLCSLMLAVQYLDIPQLLSLVSKTIADLVCAKTPDEIRETFGVTEKFTPEQEVFILSQNLWLEEISN